MIAIKDELLTNEDANVFVVDWSGGAFGLLYTRAVANAKRAGLRLSDFITSTQIDKLRAHCVGHSLGAHVCGFAGKKVKLDRITGLDPAGPLFRNQPAEARLDKADAK